MKNYNLDFKSINSSISVESFVHKWLPNGKIVGTEYLALNPTRPDKKIGSFRINLKSGKWCDFATGDKGGDLISLKAYLSSTSQIEAAQELKLITMPRRVTEKSRDKDSGKFISKIWAESLTIENTVVRQYLQSRGVTKIPKNIKYHPNLYHSPSKQYFPAMVAGITRWDSNEIIALHRTYLDSQTSSKANILSNKMMLGSVSGGVVQLSAFSQPLVLAEGIETALSVYEATGMATWAVLSASGYKNVILPPVLIARDIIIAADNDSTGIICAEAAAQKWRGENREVYITVPNEISQDFNDLLREQIK